MSLLDTIVSLRLAEPVALACILGGKWGFSAFTAMADRLQSQGWVPDTEGVYEPLPSRNAASAEPNGITPVVVQIKKQRRRLIIGLIYLTGVLYALDCVAEITYTLITKVFTPSLPLSSNILPYSIGGLAGYTALAVAMLAQEKRRQKEASWGQIYPRAISFITLALEVALVVVSARLVQTDPSAKPNVTPLPVTHLVTCVVRVMVISLLVLAQTPLLYSSSYMPHGQANTETSGLLSNGRGNATYGAAQINASKPSALRSSRPPSNRPPDPKSLSLLTMFSRVKKLFPYLWPSKNLSLQILALVCVGLMFLKRAANVAVPIFFGRIISDLSAGRSPYLSIVYYSIASFLRNSGNMLQRFLWLPIEQYSEREMNTMSFDTLLNLSLTYHTRRKTGELLRILGRTDAISGFFETLLFTFLPVCLDLPIAVVVLSIKYGFTIVSIVAVVSILYVVTSLSLAESRTKLMRQLRDEGQYMSGIKTDTLMNFETVKLFTSEAYESRRLQTAMRVYQQGYFRVYSAWNSLSVMQDGLTSLGFISCSFVLAHRVSTGQIDVGDFATFTTLLAQTYGPLNQLSGLYRTTMNNLVDTEQLMELLEETRDVTDNPNAQDLLIGDQGAGIVFDNVRFSYDATKAKETLRGVTFEVKPGQSVALVGPSGAGKTSIMRLLYRFYDINSGSIKIDGQDIRDITQHSLRKAIGLVPQEAVLFNESVRFNIAYGKGVTATDEEVIEAAKTASMHDRIMQFPDQYSTRVGERGQRLSGGEKQRVAIARVVLKNPSILCLDEATASLDTHNERMIQARLKELSRGRTTLAIAHRLSTIVDCDVIHVLDAGLIVESGSHSELLAQNGVYAGLWRKQIEGQPEDASSVSGSSSSGVATPTPASKGENQVA